MESKSVSDEIHQRENDPSNNVDERNPQMGIPPHQGSSHQQNEYQFPPHVLSPDYVDHQQSLSPVFPLMDDQSRGLPSAIMGDLFNGFHSHNQTLEHRLLNFSRVQQPRRWGSSVTKAARNKRKLVRQMSLSSSRLAHLLNSSSSGSSSSTSGSSSSSSSSSYSKKSALSTSSTTDQNQADFEDVYAFITPDNRNLRIILQKELKNSDVNSLGRIVLPKKDSEANLPSLTVKEGIQVAIREVNSTRVWRMRYRFWPNNKSRMYVLENTGEFVKQNGLKCGDFVTLYQDPNKQLYISSWKASTTSFTPLEEKTMIVHEPFSTPLEQEMKENPAQDKGQLPLTVLIDGTSSDIKFNEVGNSSSDIGTTSNQRVIEINEPPYPSRDIDIDMDRDLLCLDSMFIDFDCDFSELERLPNFDDCDLSLYDDLMKDLGNGKNDDDGGGGRGGDIGGHNSMVAK